MLRLHTEAQDFLQEPSGLIFGELAILKSLTKFMSVIMIDTTFNAQAIEPLYMQESNPTERVIQFLYV